MKTKTVRASAFQTFSATSNANTGVAGGSLTLVCTSGDTLAEALPKLPSIPRNKITKITTIKSKTEIPQIGTISFTAANDTRYAFYLDQEINGVVNTALVDYTSDASGTAAEIAAGISAVINSAKSQGSIQVVASGSSSPVTLTAQAGYPLFTIRPITGVTYASAQTSITALLQAGSISNATPRVVAATAHGLKTGDTIVIAGVTGTGEADVNGIKRVTYINANSFSLDGTSNTGTVTVTSATASMVAQQSFGSPAMVEEFMAANQISFDAPATSWYDAIDIEAQLDNDTALSVRLWCTSSLIAIPYTATTNYSQFTADLSAFKTSTAAGNVTAAAMFGIPG